MKGFRAAGRRLTRQDFLLLSASAGAGLALAGCGGGSTAVQSAGDGGKTYKGPKVNIVAVHPTSGFGSVKASSFCA